MTGGDHQERAIRLISRRWKIDPNNERHVELVRQSYSVAILALELAWRDFWRPVRNETQWLPGLVGRRWK